MNKAFIPNLQGALALFEPSQTIIVLVGLLQLLSAVSKAIEEISTPLFQKLQFVYINEVFEETNFVY